MSKECHKAATTGGKGNRGMFIERDPKVFAAGIPTAQANDTVKDALEHYLLKDEVDALISDAIVPAPKPRPLPPLRHPIPLDKRHGGLCGQVNYLVNPPTKTKFQSLADDFKETSYTSYWNKAVGKVKDPVPMFPAGFDIQGTTYGKKLNTNERLYDFLFPIEPIPDKTPHSKEAGVQKDHKYCAPPFDKDLTYGHRTGVDKRGTYARCCLTDDAIMNGTAHRFIINSIETNYLDTHNSRMGQVLAPNKNITAVPKDYAFGKLSRPDNLPQCLTFCEINQGLQFFRTCFKHLNTVRKGLSTRLLPNFYRKFYLELKYFDEEKLGWLSKETVYRLCGTHLIRFDPNLIEPLLSTWGAFDGSKIKYSTFVHVFNYREPLPDVPKIADVSDDCLDFRTTYSEMVKPGQPPNTSPMAGLPSGRYFDLNYPITPERMCKADISCLPQESDAKSCLSPSVLSQFFVSHRDMFQKREPDVVRRVFEAAGEKFTDESFNRIWGEAKKHHSEGWVCFETFRQAMRNDSENEIK
ncbi:unnamed protein product [Spodoptera exigua]|nr:unnamed protein product [Spodoptera exigua]